MELNIADTFVSHDRSMVSHWALLADQMKNGFRTFLKTAVKAPKTDSTVGQHIVDVRGQDMMVAVEFAAALCSMFDFAWPALGLHLKMDIFAPDSELVNLSSFRRRYKILIRLS